MDICNGTEACPRVEGQTILAGTSGPSNQSYLGLVALEFMHFPRMSQKPGNTAGKIGKSHLHGPSVALSSIFRRGSVQLCLRVW